MEDQYGRRTRIYLKQNRGSFNVSDSFTGNDDLNEWLKGLPDLDQRDAEQITQEIKNADSLVSTENEQSHALKQAKAWAIGLSIFSGVVSVPVMFVSYAPVFRSSLVLLALCPLLGTFLVHRFPLLFTVFKRKSDPRADIGYFIFWPGVGMLLSYQTGNDPAHLVDATQVSYWILISLVCFVAVHFRIAWQHPSRWGVLAGLLLFGGMYCTGLINAANTVLDRSNPILYRSQILAKHQTTGKHARSYLRLAPWGQIAYPEDADVPSGMYRELDVGDVVCVSLHSGFLHAPWYSLSPCGAPMATPSAQIP